MSDKCNHTDLAFPDNDAPVCIDCCEYLTDSECRALIQSLQSQLSQENKRVELLAESIGKIAVELDVIDCSMPATGPQALMIADDSLELIKYLESDLSKLEQTNLELQFQNNLMMEKQNQEWASCEDDLPDCDEYCAIMWDGSEDIDIDYMDVDPDSGWKYWANHQIDPPTHYFKIPSLLSPPEDK